MFRRIFNQAARTQTTAARFSIAQKQQLRAFSRSAMCFQQQDQSGNSTPRAAVTQPAPQFTKTALMPNGEFKDISLADYKGKWVVLFTYPSDFTFVCPSEIWAFSDRVNEFKERGAEVIACSVDSPHSHLAWTKQSRKEGGLGEMKIPIIADLNKSLCREYGVLLENEGVSLRGTFLIDPEGTVRQITVNDLPVGRSVDESLRLLDAFQQVERTGEVCPAGWKKGGKTMKPDPEGSKEFFRSESA